MPQTLVPREHCDFTCDYSERREYTTTILLRLASEQRFLSVAKQISEYSYIFYGISGASPPRLGLFGAGERGLNNLQLSDPFTQYPKN